MILNLAISQSWDRTGRGEIVADLPSRNASLFSFIIDKNDSIDVFELRFRDQEPMFIFDVEVVEGTNEVPVPSRVRLYSFHDAVDDLFRGALCKSTLQARYKEHPWIDPRGT